MKIIIILALLTCISCEPDPDFVPEHKVIAQVNQDALNADRVEEAIPSFTNTVLNEDLKTKYIKHWINQSILFQEASKQRYALSEADYFEIRQFSKQLIINKYLDEQSKKISVSDNEINDYYLLNSGEFKRNYTEVHISHLFVPESDQYVILRNQKNKKP